MFRITYVCEQVVSQMKQIKNPYRSRLKDDQLYHLLRVSPSNFNVKIEKIMNTTQQHT